MVEPFVENWQKFNSNTGWSSTESSWHDAMQALSHYSYHMSAGEFVLCDLQGGLYEDEVILTDPALLSRRRMYGMTDLGHEGNYLHLFISSFLFSFTNMS